AGCEVAGLWPLAAPEGHYKIEQWIDEWSAATGTRPTILSDCDCPVLSPTWDVLAPSGLDESGAAAALFTVANSLLRLWARWLRQFAGSSAQYLLRNFVRRHGRVVTEPGRLTVYLEARPLDLVLEMVGYQREIEPVSGLLGRAIRFRWGA